MNRAEVESKLVSIIRVSCALSAAAGIAVSIAYLSPPRINSLYRETHDKADVEKQIALKKNLAIATGVLIAYSVISSPIYLMRFDGK